MMVVSEVLLALLSLWSVCNGQIVIDTEYGPVRGQTVPDVWNGEFSADIRSFLGVPYATDTSGANRFGLPQKAVPWGPQHFVADSLGTSCPQGRGGLMSATHPGWDNYGEDCLNVNIYTPTTVGPHPVMVWFHGGAYTGGANIQYPGYFLATRNVVIVTVNYRLNHFGFAFTLSGAAPGNMGLHDQKLALEFVRDNIANFGGDPGLVTVFGQSAGASSSSLLTVSPLTQDLVHQAIMESGTESNFWSLNYPEAEPEGFIRVVADKLNCSAGFDDFQMLDCLRALPWETVRETGFDCTPGHFCQGMAPVVDGPGGFLPELPEVLRESGSVINGPIITGITRDDGSFYTSGMIPESFFGGFNRTEFLHYLCDRILSIWSPLFDNVTTENVFHAVDYNYAPWPYVEDEYENRDAFNEMITDAAFAFPMDRQCKNHYTIADTYCYVYDYRGRNATMVFAEWMGVPHMGELPQVWGWPLLQYNPAVRNDSLIFFDLIDWTEEDVGQTIFWQTLYANFAHTGNPTPVPVQDPLGGVTDWRAFTWDDMACLYVSNETVEVQTQYRQKDIAFWREYMTGYLAKDFPIPITSDYSEELKESLQHFKPKTIPSNWLDDFVTVYFDLVVADHMRELDIM